ncbi:CAP-Gly domain-containing linker protein 1-like isoform X2 [Patiria miniata]|uniref:CAP-Gly domain-containing protein n=1 Tax=Patiria miniata TaxID=46514 RepID=A0A913ZUQ5_PATMI|nr:CAP-Gly domain-containing linker protein 1-like isoform X2 [Patiria miniata]
MTSDFRAATETELFFKRFFKGNWKMLAVHTVQATQVESRLPATRNRRSLLQTPKAISSKLKSPELKPLNVSPTSAGSGIPQKSSVLQSKHLLIGQRVWTADGRVGTLQFKGKTHFSQGCLCGIQLDEPVGKNDGSVDGIQYFKCSPNHGIFIHAFKVQAVNSAGEVKPLELAPNTSGKIALQSQQGTGKDTKASSKIPSLGVSGRIARPKSLLVSEEKTTCKVTVGRRSLPKRTEVTRIECISSSEKASNGSKLFQKKRISPADSGITVPGWTHDRSPPTSRLSSIPSKSPSVSCHDATFTLSRDQSPACRPQPTDRSPPSRKRTPEQPSPRTRKSSNGSLKKGLSSRPSLNDLTQLLQDGSQAESDKSKLRKPSSARPKTTLNETFEVGIGTHRISPITGEKKYRRGSASTATATKDLNTTFDIGNKDSPLYWEPRDKVTSTPLSSNENNYFWEPEGETQSDVKATYVPLDAEEEDIEYNEFWAVPSSLDTPTGRLRFDLLTPEEFEQALKDCNIPLESPQNKVPPSFEETFAESQLAELQLPEQQLEPQLTDHCKPKVLDSLTVVDDYLLVGADLTFESIPSFLVPAWSMDSEAAHLETNLPDKKEPEGVSSKLEPTHELDEPEDPANRSLEAEKLTADNNSDITNNNTEVDPTVNNKRPAPTLDSRTSNNSAMNESDDKSVTIVPCEKSLSAKESSEDSYSQKAPNVESNLLGEEDECIFTEDLSNEWKNLVQQAEEDLETEDVPQTSKLPEVNGDMLLSSNGSAANEPKVEAADHVLCHSTSPKQETHVKVSTGEEMVFQINSSSEKAETGVAKAVSPAITLNILNTTFDQVTAEKETSFVSEGSSESASTVIAEGTSETDKDQTKLIGLRERCPSAELETVTQCEMAEMVSPSYNKKKFGPEVFDSGPTTQPATTSPTEPQKGKENSDSKLPRKRMSYLQQPKSFSSSRDSESSAKSHVAAAKLKLAAAKSSDSKPDAPAQEYKPKKGYTPSWKLNSKTPTAATSKNPSNPTSTIPKQKTTETGTGKDTKASSKLVGIKSKIDTGRRSVDLTGNKPSLTNKKSTGQNSTSSLEVEPNSLSSSNRSMKSDLSGVATKTSSRSSSIGGKPANKTTSSLRHTDRGRQERKTSTSTVNSETSQRTESRASLSSRHSTSTSDAKHHVKRPRPTPRKETPQVTPKPQAFSFSRPSRLAPTSLAKPRNFTGKQADGNQSKNDSQLTNSLTNGVTSVDAAPVRRVGPVTRLPRTSLLPSKKTDNAQQQDTTRRPSFGRADTTKSAKGRSSPSPAPSIDPEILAKAQADVKRLEALCESRTKELNLIKLNLRAGLQGFDAMSILVQYLTHKLDAFDNPHLKSRIQELQRQLEEAKTITGQKEEELGCIQHELVDTRRSNEEQVAKLQTDHLEQLRQQDERLQEQYTEQLLSTQSEHKQAINSLTEEHLTQISALTFSHHQAVQEMEEHHIVEVSKIQQQHQEHIEELNRQMETDKKQLIDEAQVKQQELHDEVYKWTFQCENHKERVMRLEEALQKDSDSKVQAAILEKRKLEADVESMKSVEELRTVQLMELRRENMALKKDLEKLPVRDDEILRLKAKVEDLKAMMVKKHDYQQQLSSDHITLRENYEREVNEKKRLSMEKEQLSWRLSLHSEGSSPVSLSPGHTFFPCTSPSRSPTRSPTRSPNPSPSVLKQNLSRSSSLDSHESGVFSPQTG